MTIEKNSPYRIKGRSVYFKQKYGTPNPTILIEDDSVKVFDGKSWMIMDGNPTCMLFGMRSGLEGINTDEGKVYYGKIKTPDGYGLAELVHESELEEIKNEKS